jgi:hypothetical protein
MVKGSRAGRRAARYLLMAMALVAPLLVGAAGQGESTAPEPSATEVPANAPEVGSAGNARVEFLVGTVTINGVDAEIGDAVPAGAEVVTGRDGRVEIVFGSGNILELRPDTELTLDTTDPANAIDLRRGQFAAVFDRLETIGMGAEDTFRVRTPATVAGVRGTAFFVAVESDDQTYVCTCNGTLNFGPDGDLTVTAARHEAYRFVAADGASRREPAPELYHDTAEFNRLAEVVDVVIEWGPEE